MRPFSHAERYPSAVAWLSIAVGAAALTGWFSGTRWLTSISREWPTMKVNSAICFLLSGLALWILRRQDLGWKQLAVARACAAVTGLFGLTALLEYKWGVDLGVDQWVLTQDELGVSYPGRMSMLTATSFVFLAGSSLGLRAAGPRLAWLARASALPPGLVGLLTLVVYGYGVRSVDAFSGFATTSLPTGCLFLALSSATMCVDAQRGPFHFLVGAGAGRDMARRLLPLAAVVPLVFAWLSLLGQRAGYYGLEFGLALFAVANVMTFSGLIWDSTLRLTRLDNARANAALAAGQLAAIVESSDDAIVSKGLDGIIKSWNHGAEILFGYPASDAIGKHVSMLIPPDRMLEEKHILAMVGSGRSVAHFDTQRLNRAGELIDISVTVSPVRDDAGEIIAASKVARDISQRRRSEGQLAAASQETANLNATLEARVKSRTDELVAANAALQQAATQLERQRAELERSNRDLEQFAYVASHDLQEPLRAVAGCGQILRGRYQGKLDAPADELIGHIVEGASRMQTLIFDLLTYSRVGRSDQRPELVDSAVAFRQASDSLQSVIDESSASVTAEPLPKVRADAAQLAQLFQNLVGNALKYRGVDPPTVHVEARRSGLDWEFAVRDNGIGIEQQYFERIFVLFQRLHTRTEYAGTGIGLALCKRIVERHGGRIWLESAAGRGSTFRFTLPSAES